MPLSAGGSFDPGGPVAAEINQLWLLMLWLGVATFVLFLVLLARGLARHDDGSGPDRSRTFLYAGGLVLPAVVITVVFAATLVSMRALSAEADEDAVIIEITGHQWWWEIEYPELGISTANEFHIPIGRDVELRLGSDDVVHSLWLPELAGKLDLLPERVNVLVLRADQPGNYGGTCAEFCGLQHTKMRITAIAETEERFSAWVDRQRSIPDPPSTSEAEEGARLFAITGCAECHTVRGTDAVGVDGPDLTHLMTRMTIGAGTLTNDLESLGNWIRRPQDHKEGISMESPDLTDAEIDSLLAYLATLE